MKITSKDLKEWGLKDGKAFGICLKVLNAEGAEWERSGLEKDIKSLIREPEKFLEHAQFGAIAKELILPPDPTVPLREDVLPYTIYGAEGIEAGAINQMEQAMRLPVSRAGALMPDAHQGYGLPIGGVLATENAIIPYGVGVDIGCRMCMSIYPIPAEFVETNKLNLETMLNRSTKFGRAAFKKPQDHEVLANPLFREIPIARELHKRAAEQIGSSGGGNHFVEFGITEIAEESVEVGLKPGKYLTLLSHSGSRGFGAGVAAFYTKVAMESCKLPYEVRHLAWLEMDSHYGVEYWLAMNLAGDYASACHHQIHDKISKDLGVDPDARIENHHNFAWKEVAADGKEYIVHRKGATPAGKGTLGIIPGSMTAPGFIVRGKGEAASINSASHGAGRAMSRTAAKNTLDPALVAKHLADAGITLIGSGIDEAPMAYKNIHEVMASQNDLVDVLGTFLPKIVKMCEDERFMEVD
ncbi:MAG: RtcB family protein [Bacteroidia bacterium]